MKKLLCLIWLLFPLWATAQINVTAIVKDANSNLYAGGFGSASLVVPSNATTQPLYSGSVFQTQVVFNIDSFGNLNGPGGINLYDNTIITPAGTQWKFSICMTKASPWKGRPCFNTNLTITGSSPQNITTQLQSAAAILNNAVISNFTVLTNAVPNLSQVSIDFRTSSTNSVGLTVTPVNASGGLERFEITGGYTGNSPTATALATTPTQCTGSNFATGIAASGNANCSAPPPGTVTSVGILGTANQVTVTGSSPITSSGNLTLSLPSTINVNAATATAATINSATVVDASKQASIQAALNLCTGQAITVVIPPGTYTLPSGLTSNCGGIDIEGYGGNGDEITTGSPATTMAATVLVVPSGQVGFTFNSSASSTNFRGPTIRNVTFVGASGALGGILIKRSNNWTIDHVGAINFGAGYGIFSDGTGNLNQYGVISNSSIFNNQIGIKTKLNSGLRIIHNHIDGAANSGVPSAGVKDIYATCPAASQNETHIISNNVLLGADILVDMECGSADVISNNRYEGFITAAVRLQKLNSLLNYGQQVKGGSINNNINGSVGVGIIVATGVNNADISNPDIIAVATTYTDAGTNTQIEINGDKIISGKMTSTTLQLNGSNQPTCDASHAGVFWYSGHANGVKDGVAVCAADASNVYAWRTIY